MDTLGPQDPSQGGSPVAAQSPATQVGTDQPQQPAAQPAAAPEKPSLWKAVVGGALAGLAGSAGSNSFGGGLARGAAGVASQQLQNRVQAREDQAATDQHTKAQEETATAYANLAHINRIISLMPPDRQTAAIESRADQTEALRRTGAMTPAGPAGEYHDVLNQVSKLHQSNPERLYTPEPVKGADGKITWQPFESTDAPIGEDTKFDLPNGQTASAPKGSITGKQATQYQLGILQQQLADQSAKNANDKLKAQAAMVKANKTGGDKAAVNPAALTPDALGFQPKLPVTGAAGYQKVQGSFKKNIDDLSQTEQAYQQFADILKDVNSGKDLTGAQSIVSLFNAIGISAEPLKGKGFRINNLTVAEHAQARGLREAIEQKVGKLKTGEIITPNQLRDYANIAAQVRENKYTSLVNQMHNAGLNADAALPTGNGQKADPGTARIFLRLVGWTGGQPTAEQKQRAADAMQKKGWQ